MLETLFPYQIDGALWLSNQTHALLADDMGLGKSAQTIRAADLIGAETILVVCPAAVRINWAREFEKFSPMDRPCTVIQSGKDPIPTYGVVIISYDLAVPMAHLLKARKWDIMVLDEAHYLKERSAKRTKAIYGRSKSLPGIGASAKRTWRLSGTPAPNNAAELYTHLYNSGTTRLSYWDFMYRFCSGFNTDYGYQITGHKNVDELKALMSPFLLRRKKEEVLDLPPIMYQTVTVEAGKVDLPAHTIRDLEVAGQSLTNALAAISGPNELTDQVKVLESSATSLATLRRYLGMAKVENVAAIIEDELASRQLEKIVIFAYHTSVVAALAKRFAKFGVVTLNGDTYGPDRQKVIDRFQQDKNCRVFLGNIIAAGTGITLTASHEVAFVEQSWVPAENAQAAMRCHRIGQSKSVRVRVFSLNQSVDEQIQQVLVRKSRELAKII